MEETYEDKIKRIETETRNISKKITTFDENKTSPEVFDQWFKQLDALRREVDDLKDELKVEDFLISVDELIEKEKENV